MNNNIKITKYQQWKTFLKILNFSKKKKKKKRKKHENKK